MITDYNKKQKGGLSRPWRGSLSAARRNFYFIAGGIIFMAASGFLILADFNVYRDRQTLNSQLNDYKNQVQEIQNRNEDFKKRIAQENNNDYVERVAREELDLQKSGEKVVAFIMPPQPKTEAPKQKNLWDGLTAWISGIFKK